MTKKERAQMIVERLEQVYPEGICSLDYKKPHELMIAGRLSAQCTDARVNKSFLQNIRLLRILLTQMLQISRR